MAKANPIETLNELRGADRVFQLDRDTFVVYTGLHAEDLRPFARVGAGTNIPTDFVTQIENVLLPDQDPPNLGLEYAWIESTRRQTEATIRYVGSKEQVSTLYNYTGMPELEEDEFHPVEAVAYQPVRRGQEVRGKDKSTIMFYKTGNAQIQVGGTRTYDHDSVRRSRPGIDREYDWLSRAMRKRERKCGDVEQRSFLFTGAMQNPDRPFIYFSFGDQGVLLNPTVDPHYRLFEVGIDPDDYGTAINHSPYAPGFVETLRRKSHKTEPMAVYTMGAEALSQLKRVYKDTKVQAFMDGSALPFAREVSWYLSRTESHGAFAYRMSQGSDRLVQIMVPLGAAKASYKFDFLRPPYDLEILPIHTRDQLKEEGGSHLTLTVPGQFAADQFAQAPARDGVYPLVPACEYILFSSDEVETLIEKVLEFFRGLAYEEVIRDFLMLNSSLDYSEESLERSLDEMRVIDAGDDLMSRQNIAMLLTFVRELPLMKHYSPRLRRKLDRLTRRYSGDTFRNSDWLALADRPIAFEVVFVGGRNTLLFVRSSGFVEPVRFQLPPSAEELSQDPKSYARLLKVQGRAIEKADDPPGYRECLETMEKLYEERLRLVEERQRFKEILRTIEEARALESGAPTSSGPSNGMALASGSNRPEPELTFGQKLADIWDGFVVKMQSLWEWMRESRVGMLVVPLLLIIVVGLIAFGAISAMSGGESSETPAIEAPEDGAAEGE